MSGIVGSRFNTRGSGLVGSLGTDGQVFTSSGAGTGAVFEAAAAGGAWTKIVRKTISDGDALVEFDDTELTSTYRVYKVIASGFKPDTATEAELYIQTQHGGSYVTSGYRHCIGSFSDSSANYQAIDRSQSASQISCTWDNLCSDTAGEGAYFEFTIDYPKGTAIEKIITSKGHFKDHNGYLRHDWGSGTPALATAIEAIKFYPSTGGWESGEFTLYGLTT